MYRHIHRTFDGAYHSLIRSLTTYESFGQFQTVEVDKAAKYSTNAKVSPYANDLNVLFRYEVGIQ